MLTQKIVEKIGRAIFVILVIDRDPLFIAFMTGKMFGREYFLKWAGLDLDFNDRKVDQSFGKRINAFSTNFHCPFSQHERF